MSRPLILFGGGLDSCVLVERYKARNPFLLYFSYGQKALVGELAALRYFTNKHNLDYWIMELDKSLIPSSPLTDKVVITDPSKHSQNYIPGRNMIFSALGFSFAAAHDLAPIMLGASPAPPESAFHDAKFIFEEAFNRLSHIGYPDQAHISLRMPLLQEKRDEYIAKALKEEPRLFLHSFTCYESTTELECGQCVHCQQKVALAKQLGAVVHRSVAGL